MTCSKHSDDMIEETIKYDDGPKIYDASSLKTRILLSRGNIYDEIPEILLPESLRYMNRLYEKHKKLEEQLENEKSVNEKEHLKKELNDLEALIKKKNDELYSKKVNFCVKHVHEIYRPN